MALAWAKKGADAAKAVEEENKKKMEEIAKSRKLWKFFLPKEGGSADITFVDGNLTADKLLDILTYRQHKVNYAGTWTSFICTADAEPCPICEGDDKANMVGCLTIIDHRESTSGDKTYKDQKRLFEPSSFMIAELQKLAVEHGGLAGLRVTVTRKDGNKQAATGKVTKVIGKTPVKKLEALYQKAVWEEQEQEDGSKKWVDTGKTETYFTPADYEQELEYLDAKALRAKGFGSQAVLGSEPPLTDSPAGNSTAGLEEQL